MAKKIGIGHQDFAQLVMNDIFYVDKTGFIKEWWENEDVVTLITRPRRFGKTLTLSMAGYFFSIEHAGRGDLFQEFSIWKEERYRQLQGTYPVISLSFANVKERDFRKAYQKICFLIVEIYGRYRYLLDAACMTGEERDFFDLVAIDMPDWAASLALYRLSSLLYRYHGKKVIILMDEYDTPMQEAYVGGYWEEMTVFIRSMFNATFKTNPYLERAIMTGITRVSKESIFSDLNNLEVVTATSDKYGDAFGFTEEEVFAAMDAFGLEDKQGVKQWYNGFIFGKAKDIYNPWSVLNYLDKKKVDIYWANTSSNSLVGKLIREGDEGLKSSFGILLAGGRLVTAMDEQIIYDQLDGSEEAIWSLLVAGGYLKVVEHEEYRTGYVTAPKYGLELTDLEVKVMFQKMVRGWFSSVRREYNGFIKALLLDDLDGMNAYMERVARQTFSFFDTGRYAQPERFYHGFVLGLMVELQDRYRITSNRESGLGRYDIMLEPLSLEDPGVVIEFKVFDPKKEKDLKETVENALAQIREKRYETGLQMRGIPAERIRRYGFAFAGKAVLIG